MTRQTVVYRHGANLVLMNYERHPGKIYISVAAQKGDANEMEALYALQDLRDKITFMDIPHQVYERKCLNERTRFADCIIVSSTVRHKIEALLEIDQLVH